MQTILTSIKTVVSALLLAVAVVPVIAQEKSEVVLTPQLEEVLQNYDSYSSEACDGAIIVKHDSKYGLIATDGSEITPCIYGSAYFFYEGLSRVSLDGYYGFINPQGEVVVPIRYDYAESFNNGFAKVGTKNKWGFINTNGEEVVSCIYDFVDIFSNGYAKVVIDGEYGFVNSYGEEVISCKYDYVDSFNDYGLARVELNDYYGFVNTQGEEVVPCEYDFISVFDGDFAIIRKGNEISGKKGLINSKGQIMVPCEYDDVEVLERGLIEVAKYDGENHKYGIITIDGQVIVPCEYDGVNTYYENFIKVIKTVQNGEWYDDKYGIISTTGEMLLPCEYDYIFDFREGLAQVGKTGNDNNINSYGLINTKGQLILPCEYNNIGDFEEGLAIVTKGEWEDAKYGVINTIGEFVVPCKYDYVNFFSERFAAVELNNKWGFINTKGEEVIPCKFDDVGDFHEGLAYVRKDDNGTSKYGFINIRGEEIIDCIYDDACDFQDGTAKVITKGKCGTIDSNGTFTFSHNITVDDVDWLINEWDGVTIQASRKPTQVTIIDRKGHKRIAELGFDEKTGKYILYSIHNGHKKIRYYVDMANYDLLGKDGSVLSRNKLTEYNVVADKEVREAPKVNYEILEDEYKVEVCAPLAVDTPQRHSEPRMISIKPEPNYVSLEVFKSAATMPSFPGGIGALMNYINQNVRYPQAAQDNNIQGKVVVQFVVEKDGSIGEVKIVRSVDKDLDNEAKRVCKTLPKFSPGRNSNDDPIRVWYTLPIMFKLTAPVEEDEQE